MNLLTVKLDFSSSAILACFLSIIRFFSDLTDLKQKNNCNNNYNYYYNYITEKNIPEKLYNPMLAHSIYQSKKRIEFVKFNWFSHKIISLNITTIKFLYLGLLVQMKKYQYQNPFLKKRKQNNKISYE